MKRERLVLLGGRNEEEGRCLPSNINISQIPVRTCQVKTSLASKAGLSVICIRQKIKAFISVSILNFA